MKNQSILYGLGGLLIGAVLSGLIVANIKNENVASDNSMTMSQMSEMLKGKTGDDFDKEFISGMIEHHEGAVEMANLAKQNAKHDEIKKMADDIISAQSKEIDMMKTWQTDWGYQSTPKSHDMQNMGH